MEFMDDKTIKLDRILSELDKFVLETIGIISEVTDYVIVSGYVSILFGRTRMTEDVDVLIPSMPREIFERFLEKLKADGFWIVNSDSTEGSFELLESYHSIRIARDQKIVPNIELKFVKDDADRESLSNALTVKMGEYELKISPLELQIAYKEEILKSEKDLEDAKHLFEVFKDELDLSLIEKYRTELKNES